MCVCVCMCVCVHVFALGSSSAESFGVLIFALSWFVALWLQGWVAILFFCTVVVLGMFVLLNVFLAIAVKTLDDARDLKEARDEVRG